YCNSMVAQADGRLLVAGSAGGQGFAARLRENGQRDPGFSAGSVSAAMTEATAVAAAGDGSVVVAGIGASGASVVRLLDSGDLDAMFGSGGNATFDLETDGPVSPVIRDLYVQADTNIVGAGGVCRPDCYWYSQAFVVRLLGTSGESPGVLGISEQLDIQTTEGDGEVVVSVRRTGGRSGSISLDWETAPGGGSWPPATPGEDYTAVSGSLTWADGDTAEQEIRVPIIANGPIDETETLRVLLTDSHDGAGLGMRSATIVIAADGAPHGQFGFPESLVGAVESQPLRVPVFRDFYSSGVVSVTVTATSGTAIAGQDFAADPVTLSWADGESGWKDAVIQMFNDSGAEDAETFTLELSNPTGGAVIGPRSSATVRIAGNDRQLSGDGSGGGAFGWLSLLLLGFVRLLRRCTVRHTASQSAGAKRVSNR
ncbi:MAG: hypothetical protein OEW59_00535, partial [Gammaproteobacteria bacterium]|nr:hypothetical protein [Gammaproteobacteria bacterium]